MNRPLTLRERELLAKIDAATKGPRIVRDPTPTEYRRLEGQLADERLNGSAKHVRIEPSIPWGQYLACLAVAAFIDFALAVGGF